MKYCRI